MSADKVSSPSRTYVAICNKTNFDGFYCKKFIIPPLSSVANNAERASWYFINVLDPVACVEKVIPFEDYSDLSDADMAFADTSKQIAKLVNGEPTLPPVDPHCTYCGKDTEAECICDWKKPQKPADIASTILSAEARGMFG